MRDFRFLMVADTVRGRELEAFQKQLERKLETLNKRLELADSLLSQIDVRLDRARLEQEIESVAGQIHRLRLQNMFESRVAAPEMEAVADKDTQETSGFQKTSAQAAGDEIINLLA
ncbi:MAG: hypothetical protein C4520_18520 [Candidatus Abyssobacteria bacterium SURF_5]|uniref:Uncharacterized protein n=1 Tax=Abyssobacteria bacterium (strain SURF_5) TaxID=2093360 RepID=A0A3A4N3X2_ABYX5|nr:MAG: hypothetical protein C4520_18520 [Candidatus Abyssubacteria bacterium SURF_5]